MHGDPLSGWRLKAGTLSVATYPAGSTFGPRTLQDFEFVWILDGDVVWTVDGVEVPAPAGTLLLGRPGMRDAFRWDPRRPTRHGFVHFAINRRSPQLPPESQWPLVRRLGSDDVIAPLLQHLAWLQARRPAAWEPLAHAVLAQVLVAFVLGASGLLSDEATSADSPLIDRVLALVRTQWAAGKPGLVPVQRLARQVGVSRGHLIRIFNRDLGVGPAEALRLLRLHRAASLLARTNLQVQAVAEEAGFANPFHFTKAFHAVYGCAPRVFRKRCAEGAPVPTLGLVRIRQFSDLGSAGAS